MKELCEEKEYDGLCVVIMLVLKSMNEGGKVQGIQLDTYAVCMFDLNILCYATWT